MLLVGRGQQAAAAVKVRPRCWRPAAFASQDRGRGLGAEPQTRQKSCYIDRRVRARLPSVLAGVVVEVVGGGRGWWQFVGAKELPREKSSSGRGIGSRGSLKGAVSLCVRRFWC